MSTNTFFPLLKGGKNLSTRRVPRVVDAISVDFAHRLHSVTGAISMPPGGKRPLLLALGSSVCHARLPTE